MTVPPIVPPAHPAQRFRTRLGVALLVLGLVGHLLAAHAIGGSRMAYTHHVGGFFLILIVTGGIVAAMGWKFWRGRRDVTMLIIGLIQALFGLFVYIERFRVRGA